MLSNRRGQHNERPAHHNWRVVPTHHNRDPAQPKANKHFKMNKVHTFLDDHTSVEIRAFLFFMSRGRVSVVVQSQKSGSSTSTLETIMLSDISTLADHNLRRQWHPTPVLLPGKSHGWRSLLGCSPRGHEESDTTEQLHFHFSLSCIGEGNGNPLQCSCLENPRDGGAWWAAVYGVAQSRTQLK